MIPIEEWKEVFKNEIPQSQYNVFLQNGEEKGLVIKLVSQKSNVLINFGAVSAFRMLDEGIALNGLFDDKQIKKFRDAEFANVIYQITEGDFGKFIQQIGGGLYEYLNLKHYVIVSENFIVEVVTEWEPDIHVL